MGTSHMFILQIPTHALNCSNRGVLISEAFLFYCDSEDDNGWWYAKGAGNIYLFPFVPMKPVNGSQEHGVSYINSVKFLNLRAYPES